MPYTILYIEDNPDNRLLVKRALEARGYQFVGAQNGLEGLDLTSAKQPDIILLDINLPDISGIDLLTSIKKDSNLCDIPVVILTGSNEDQDIQKSYDLGAGSYLVKPISNDALMLVIEKLFYP